MRLPGPSRETILTESLRSSTAAAVIAEPKLLVSKELRRLLLGWPGVGWAAAVPWLDSLLSGGKRYTLANHCGCRTRNKRYFVQKVVHAYCTLGSAHTTELGAARWVRMARP